MIHLEATAVGVVLSVRAKAGARVNALQGVHEGALKVAVAQAPERGKANRAIIELLAETLGLRKSQIKLVSGETSQQKRFVISDITPDDLSARIAAVLRRGK
jgi:uncharacterized protein (TIGR00251 family)